MARTARPRTCCPASTSRAGCAPARRPYLGIGWGFGPKAGPGLSFTADLGASYGSLRAEYDVSPGMQRYWGNDRVQQERRKFDDKVRDYRWAPVVRVGVSYRF